MNDSNQQDIGEVLAYATGLLVGDMAIRDQIPQGSMAALEQFREKWAEQLQVRRGKVKTRAAWERGFDRALEGPLPKGQIGRQLNDNALAIAGRIAHQAGIVSRLLGSLDRMEPSQQREVIEACSRLMRDMDERLASVAGIPNLPK